MDRKKRVLDDLVGHLQDGDAAVLGGKPVSGEALNQEADAFLANRPVVNRDTFTKFLRNSNSESNNAENEGEYELDPWEYASFLRETGRSSELPLPFDELEKVLDADSPYQRTRSNQAAQDFEEAGKFYTDPPFPDGFHAPRPGIPTQIDMQRELRPQDRELIEGTKRMHEELDYLNDEHGLDEGKYSVDDYAKDLKRFRPQGSPPVDYVPSREEAIKYLSPTGSDTQDYANPAPEDMAGIGDKYLDGRKTLIENMSHYPPFPSIVHPKESADGMYPGNPNPEEIEEYKRWLEEQTR